MGLSIIKDDESLKLIGMKKPVLIVKKENEIIKVASFNNKETLNLFIDALKGYGLKIGETKEIGNRYEVDEKSFIE